LTLSKYSAAAFSPNRGPAFGGSGEYPFGQSPSSVIPQKAAPARPEPAGTRAGRHMPWQRPSRIRIIRRQNHSAGGADTVPHRWRPGRAGRTGRGCARPPGQRCHRPTPDGCRTQMHRRHDSARLCAQSSMFSRWIIHSTVSHAGPDELAAFLEDDVSGPAHLGRRRPGADTGQRLHRARHDDHCRRLRNEPTRSSRPGPRDDATTSAACRPRPPTSRLSNSMVGAGPATEQPSGFSTSGNAEFSSKQNAETAPVCTGHPDDQTHDGPFRSSLCPADFDATFTTATSHGTARHRTVQKRTVTTGVEEDSQCANHLIK